MSHTHTHTQPYIYTHTHTHTDTHTPPASKLDADAQRRGVASTVVALPASRDSSLALSAASPAAFPALTAPCSGFRVSGLGFRV